eukprot:2988402-Amphidinium_carterae.2
MLTGGWCLQPSTVFFPLCRALRSVPKVSFLPGASILLQPATRTVRMDLCQQRVKNPFWREVVVVSELSASTDGFICNYVTRRGF